METMGGGVTSLHPDAYPQLTWSIQKTDKPHACMSRKTIQPLSGQLLDVIQKLDVIFFVSSALDLLLLLLRRVEALCLHSIRHNLVEILRDKRHSS